MNYLALLLTYCSGQKKRNNVYNYYKRSVQRKLGYAMERVIYICENKAGDDPCGDNTKNRGEKLMEHARLCFCGTEHSYKTECGIEYFGRVN